MSNLKSKTALILPGGGAKGAWQVGAIKALREHGYDWDIVLGISVGALNAAMIGCEDYDQLEKIWSNIKKSDIYTWRFFLSYLFNFSYLANKKPLEKLLKKYFNPEQIKKQIIVGSVNYNNGKFLSENISINKESAIQNILASCSIPVFWKPEKINGSLYVDGGVVKNNPISTVLSLDVDHVIILNLDLPKINEVADPKNIIEIGARTYELAGHYLMDNDIKHFLAINRLVKQAEENGYSLYSPSGKQYKYIKYTILYPKTELCGTLDFDKKTARKLIDEGYDVAKEYCCSITE